MIRVLPRSRTAEGDQHIPVKQIDWIKLLTVIAFLTPGFILMFTILYIPVTQSVKFSQYRWNGLGPLEENVGWENFERLYYADEYRQAELFREAVEHTLTIVSLSLLIQLPFAMMLALMVGRGEFVGKKLLRTIFFVPYVFSDPITAILWIYALHPSSGLVNTVLDTIIPGFENVAWLGDPDKPQIALYSVFLVLTWKYFGVYMILYMAALQGVPRDLEDAARIDGANELNVLWRVTLPLIGRTIRLTIYLSVLGALQQFVIIWILTQGGPVGSTEVIGTYLYKHGIARWRLGFGSAIAVVIFGMSFLFSIGYQWIVMRQDYKSMKEAY